MVDMQSPTAEIRQKRKKKERRQKPQLQNIMACQLLWAAIKSKHKPTINYKNYSCMCVCAHITVQYCRRLHNTAQTHVVL